MAIEFDCEHCGHHIKVKSEHAGSKGHCPKCKGEVRVPAAVKAGAGEEDFDPVAFLSEEPDNAPRKPVTIPADLSEEREERSSDRGAKSASSSPKEGSASAAADVWDQAMAAREMRNALKASVRQAKEKREQVGGGIEFELRDIVRDYGPKILGGLVLISVVAGGIYWMFDSMLGGRLWLPKLGYVSGVVTVDGEPLGNAMVYFSPIETEVSEGRRDRARTSIGITDSSGRFTMKYMEGVDGVAVGQCRVWVECMGPDGKPLVPPEYGQGAGQTREVSSGKQTMSFQMTSRKAAAKPK